MALDPLQLGILVLVGVLAGFLNVMAGGGSMLVLPIMVFMGIPGNIANGTNRIAMLAQNLTAATTFYKKGVSNFRLSVSLAVCALPGALVGAYLGTQIEGKSFNLILAGVMIVVMAMMIFAPKPTENNNLEIPRNRLLIGHFLMLFVGFWGGFIMAGVGFIMIAVMNKVMGIDLVSSNAHKVLIEIVFTVFALAIFASQLQLLWLAGLFLGLGNAIGGWFGAHYQTEKGGDVVRKILYVVLAVFIIKLIFFS
ncbi:MAG: sulfite exporter TauE/SafE family protein [Arenicella sp.]